MAYWNLRAQVISLGVVDMGENFVTYQGVKVVLPDGKRKFLGKVIMHNEINALFMETEGEFVDLYLSGPGEKHPSLLYGMKTEREDAYNGSSPFVAEKAQWGGYFLMSLGLCFVLVGFLMVPVCFWSLNHLSKWDPPAKKLFDAHVPAGEKEGMLQVGLVPA